MSVLLTVTRGASAGVALEQFVTDVPHPVVFLIAVAVALVTWVPLVVGDDFLGDDHDA